MGTGRLRARALSFIAVRDDVALPRPPQYLPSSRNAGDVITLLQESQPESKLPLQLEVQPLLIRTPLRETQAN